MECFSEKDDVVRMSVEDIIPENVKNEDHHRYKFISDNIPFILNIIYRIAFFYYQKLLRERFSGTANLKIMNGIFAKTQFKNVICISHRPAFWLSNFKGKNGSSFGLWGIATEFGQTLAWKYIFWSQINGFMTPMEKSEFDYDFHEGLTYKKIDAPCRKRFRELKHVRGDKDKTMFIAGYWGQISIKTALNILKDILREIPSMRIKVICGINIKLFNKVEIEFRENEGVELIGSTDSVDEHLSECASIITKPGFSTIVEAHNAGRHIFLLKGMPVAEDQNARYAIKNFNAEWFSPENMKNWMNREADRTA